MNAESFINNFGHLVNAPEGPMRIRELILQLAFSGDLTIRSAEDEDASVVFDLNQQSKANWIAEGKVRQQPALNSLSADERPWELPETWLWCRLGEVTTYGSTDKAEFLDATPDTWVLELEDIEKDTSRLLAKVRAKERRFQSSKNRFSKRDVLYGKLRPYLDKVVLADEDGVCTTEIIPVTIYSGILPEYLRWFLKSPFFKAYANGSTHGMNLPRMGTEAARNAVFPLAPLAEQKRIVAKVDELMALCDRLEAQQQERERRFPVLSRTCHARFAEAPTPANLNRIFEETGSVSPADLRKTILTLAVQAKLVPQNRKDEAADKLLERIKKEREIYAEENRFRTSHENSIDEAAPTLLPSTWRWARMSSLFNAITDGDHLPPPKSSEGIAFLTIGNVTTGQLDFEGCRFVPKSYYDKLATFRRPLPGDILYTVVGATYGRPALVETERPFCVQRHIAILKSAKSMDVTFLLLVLQSPFVYEQATKSTTGTAQPTIPLSALRNFLLPLPPLAEQRRIVAKVDELIALVDHLEAQQQERDKLAEAFAKACVASFTGTAQLEEPEKMKAPKTELVSIVTIGKKPKPNANAPLAQLLSQNKGTLPAKSLWQQSGLTIDAFYHQLKTEIAEDWITPDEAHMRVVEEPSASAGVGPASNVRVIRLRKPKRQLG